MNKNYHYTETIALEKQQIQMALVFLLEAIELGSPEQIEAAIAYAKRHVQDDHSPIIRQNRINQELRPDVPPAA